MISLFFFINLTLDPHLVVSQMALDHFSISFFNTTPWYFTTHLSIMGTNCGAEIIWYSSCLKSSPHLIISAWKKMLVTYNTDREMKRKCTYQLIFFLFLHQQQLWTFVHSCGRKQRCFPKYGWPLSSRAHSSPCDTEWICDHYCNEFFVNGTKYNNKKCNKKHHKPNIPTTVTILIISHIILWTILSRRTISESKTSKTLSIATCLLIILRCFVK